MAEIAKAYSFAFSIGSSFRITLESPQRAKKNHLKKIDHAQEVERLSNDLNHDNPTPESRILASVAYDNLSRLNRQSAIPQRADIVLFGKQFQTAIYTKIETPYKRKNPLQRLIPQRVH